MKKKDINIISKIDYATFYKSIQYSNILSVLLNATNIFTKNIYITSAMLPFVIYSLISVINFDSLGVQTKDVSLIDDTFKSIISDYSKLTKNLEFDNPAYVAGMFKFALLNGYLSFDKSFEIKCDNTCEIPFILGSIPICGYGVCRHITSFLDAIYKELDMNSSKVKCITGLKNEPSIAYIEKEKYEYVKEMFNEYIMGNITKKELYAKVMDDFKVPLSFRQFNSYFMINDKTILRGGNHVVNLVKDDDGYYMFDITNLDFLNKKGHALYLNIKDQYAFIPKTETSLDNIDENEFKDIQDVIKDFLVADSICKNNEDIFIKFYKDHKDQYEYINNEATKSLKQLKKWF